MKAIEQYFPVVLFIMLYKVALTFESLDETLKCDHSYQTFPAILSHGTVWFSIFFSKWKFDSFLELGFEQSWNWKWKGGRL